MQCKYLSYLRNVEPFILLSLSVSLNRILLTDERFCSLILGVVNGEKEEEETALKTKISFDQFKLNYNWSNNK